MTCATGAAPVPDSAALCAAVLPLWLRLLQTSQAQSETAVFEMMSAFSQMTPYLDAATTGLPLDPSRPEADSGELGRLIERILVGFQYQDRTSQMLALLQADMQRMVLALTGTDAAPVLDSVGWLQRLEAQYVMAEQRRDHHAVDGHARVGPAADETIFF